MAASAFDSAHFRGLFHDPEVGRLLTDSAEIRAMLLVEGTLAKVQGDLGLIPADSAQAIHRASLELQIDPAGLAAETGQSAVVVPALVKAFRKAMEAPDHSQYAHWGATSQDIMDTGLVLRLRQILTLYEARLRDLIATLGTMAEAHADLPMAGRTYGQVATPTSFGAVVASWGHPLIAHLDRLTALRPRLLMVSLSGAAGTLSAMGDDGPAVRAALAEALALGDPGRSWHATRDTLAELSGWMTLLTGSLAKAAEDLLAMTQSGLSEVTLGTGGGSSTMPQKANPVLPSVLVAIANLTRALNGAMQGATAHRQQRDGAAWLTEWLSLPQMLMATGRALSATQALMADITPDPARMLAQIEDGTGLIHAEALSFALAAHMPRPEAQDAVKTLCKRVKTDATPLPDLARAEWPALDLSAVFDTGQALGTAPQEAREFAMAAKNI